MNSLTIEETKMSATEVRKITPVLVVEEVEPCIRFWVERLGFEKTVEVPEGDRIGFVILQRGAVELMYQSLRSVQRDAPKGMQPAQRGPTFLYTEVGNLDEIIAAMKGVEVAMAERVTFYGAREIGVKDPAGHFVIFAQLGDAPQS